MQRVPAIGFQPVAAQFVETRHAPDVARYAKVLGQQISDMRPPHRLFRSAGAQAVAFRKSSEASRIHHDPIEDQVHRNVGSVDVRKRNRHPSVPTVSQKNFSHFCFVFTSIMDVTRVYTKIFDIS
jgi:hypothetical protein